MRDIIRMISVVLFVTVSITAFAEGDQVLATAKGQCISGDKGTQEIQKVLSADGVFILVRDEAGKQIWKSENLGSEDKVFTYEEKGQKLALKDFTGDGAVEIITAAFYGPKASGVYVFTWDPTAKTFKPIMVSAPGDDEPRDLLVSDIRMEDGSDMIFQKDGKVRLTGMVYPEKPEDSPVGAFYFFEFEKGQFVQKKVEQFPAEPGK